MIRHITKFATRRLQMEATDRPGGAIKGIGRAGKEEIVWRRLPGLVLLGASAAAVGNALVYLAGSGLGTISPSVLLPSPMGSSALGLSLVVATSALALLAAAIVLLGIGAVSRRPMTVFRIVATLGLLLSLAMPATIPGPPLAMRLTLGLMHVVAWAVSLVVLSTLAARRAEL